ncbi:MAG TPA: ornithine cyclodeaminase family protein [Pseudonocardiaceae bacterium]|jgi:ornithine cyclodeaminase|nr:ornithine cyclodeaminase family protein [Pseudonocardiaceae bacterium]
MRIVGREDLAQLLPMGTAIELMRELFANIETPAVVQPLRSVVRVDGQPSVLGSMPAFVAIDAVRGYGTKTVVVNPENAARGMDTHLGAVLVFDPLTGQPAAVLEAGALTGIRTAAVSAVATDALAPAAARELAVLGSGVQARLHLEAISMVRPLTGVSVWSRTREHAEAFARWARGAFDLPVRMCESGGEAAARADIVCTVTGSATPVLALADVRPGAHINAVGACFPTARELASDLVCAARIVVDSVESALAEAGDLLIPISEGCLRSADVNTTLAGVLTRAAIGRRHDDQVTVFESLGLAAEDVAAGCYVARRARETDAGIEVPF